MGGREWPRVGLEGEYCKCTTEKMGMYHTHHKTCCHSQQQKSLGWIFIHTFLIKKERKMAQDLKMNSQVIGS